MTREKALGWLCVALLLLVGYLSRDDVTTLNKGFVTVVHNRWTGSIVRCVQSSGCTDIRTTN